MLYVAVMFAYEQCLLVLGHHPDIWYEAAQYLEQSSKLLAEKGVRDFKQLSNSEFGIFFNILLTSAQNWLKILQIFSFFRI